MVEVLSRPLVRLPMDEAKTEYHVLPCLQTANTLAEIR
jgi:hypothetical protein